MQLVRESTEFLYAQSTVRLFVVMRLIHGLSRVQVLEPSFDIASWNKHQYRVVRAYPGDFGLVALPSQLKPPFACRICIRIRDYEKNRIALATNRLQLVWEPLADPLFTGASGWQRKAVKIVVSDSALPQEATNETLGPGVLAEQPDLCSHSCKPRAIVSEIDSPPLATFGSSLTRTGPSPSRKNQRP